jgi:hypothetical protein
MGVLSTDIAGLYILYTQAQLHHVAAYCIRVNLRNTVRVYGASHLTTFREI